MAEHWPKHARRWMAKSAIPVAIAALSFLLVSGAFAQTPIGDRSRIGCWTLLVASGIVFAWGHGASWPLALLIAAILNLIGAGALGWFTLKLAKDHPFARRLVNSGRLSVPATLVGSALNTPDRDPFAGSMVPGAPAADAPVRVGNNADWFLSRIGGEFGGVYFSDNGRLPAAIASALGGWL